MHQPTICYHCKYIMGSFVDGGPRCRSGGLTYKPIDPVSGTLDPEMSALPRCRDKNTDANCPDFVKKQGGRLWPKR